MQGYGGHVNALRRSRKDVAAPRASPLGASVARRQRRGRYIALAMLSTALVACSREPEPEVTGTAEPPSEFGIVSARTKGCPDLEGLYGWPWAQGQPFGYRSPTLRDKFGDFIGMPLHAESQIWVSGPGNAASKELAIRTRMVNRDPSVSIQSLTHEWSYTLRGSGEYTCDDGWVALPETDVPGDSVGHWYGGEGVKVSARITRLDDSSLVVGQRVRVWGRTTDALPVQSKLKDRRLPDEVRWYWTRLALIGPSGKDVPPADANGSDRRSVIECRDGPCAAAAIESAERGQPS